MIEKILEGLNNEQREAATTINGNIRLIAGAGSGKTNTLTKRVAYICLKNNIAPERVLSLTFTNKAAKEMKERAAKLMGVDEDSLQMMTFHRLALDIDKKHLKELGYPTKVENGEELADILIGSTPIAAIAKDFFDIHKEELETLSEGDREFFMTSVLKYTKSIIREHNYVNLLLDKDFELSKPSDVVAYERKKQEIKAEKEKEKKKISNIRKHIKEHYGKNADIYEYLDSLRKIEKNISNMSVKIDGEAPTKSWAKALLQMKIATKTLDFDDLIMFADYLLKNYENVREYWQNQYDFIQVDEFQDTDWTQLSILKILSEKHHNLFMVGDPDQSIYMFRGVKPEVFNTLDEHLDDLKTIFMENNYRSTSSIVKAANSVIDLNKDRIKKTLKSMKKDELMFPLLICTGTDSYTAAQQEFMQIRKMIQNGVDPNNICVLYRDKNCEVTGELVSLLKTTDIPLDCQFKPSSFTDKYVEATTNLLKYKYTDNLNFLGNLIDTLFDDDNNSVFDKEQLNDVDCNNADSVVVHIELIIPKKLSKTGKPIGKYKEFLEKKDIIKVAVSNTIDEWNKLTPSEKKAACSEDAILDTEEELANGLHIMTMHKSKGLEFDYVFCNMDNGECPKYNSFMNLDSLEEDVRLAYVAITRAKKQLYIGFKDMTTMSPFTAMLCQNIMPTYSSKVNMLDENALDSKVEEFLRMLDCYYMLSYEGIYELKNHGILIGYRYQTMLNGRRVYYQIKTTELIKTNAAPVPFMGSVEVLLDENDKIKAFEEINDTAKIYNINVNNESKECITNCFNGNGNPLGVLGL